MIELGLADKIALAHVKRWHMVRVMREQNVAEHSYAVAQIVREIGAELEWTEQKTNYAVVLALDHDLNESLYGDVPTPTKEEFGYQPIKCNPEHVKRNPESGYGKANDEEIEAVLKFADLIEAVHFLDEEGGNTHAFSVREYLWRRLHDQIIRYSGAEPGDGPFDFWLSLIEGIFVKLRTSRKML